MAKSHTEYASAHPDCLPGYRRYSWRRTRADCEAEIERLQAGAASSRPGSLAGPTAPQSIEAQLGYQPTPASVERAEQTAQSRLAGVLATARSKWPRQARRVHARRQEGAEGSATESISERTNLRASGRSTSHRLGRR